MADPTLPEIITDEITADLQQSELFVLQGGQETPKEYADEPIVYEIPSCDIRCVRCHHDECSREFPLRRVCSVVSLPDLTAVKNTSSSVMLSTQRMRRSLSLVTLNSSQMEENFEDCSLNSSLVFSTESEEKFSK